MPISCEYTWQETPFEIELWFKLKGVSPTNVDIFATDYFVRINAPPKYLTTVDFKHEVNESQSTARFDGHTLRMVFPKKLDESEQSGKMWNELLFQGTSQERDERRRKATEEKQKQDEQERQRRKDAKHDYDRQALRKQMSLEESQRAHLSKLKEQEKKESQKEIFETFANIEKSDHSKDCTSKPENSEIWSSTDSTNQTQQATKSSHGDVDDEGGYIPPPRSLRQGGKAKVTVKFSERPFPTPLRDSRKAEEQDWLKQNQHRIDAKKRRDREQKGLGLNDLEHRDISERNPEWIKSKGDEFYSQGDFLGAINAYSATLTQAPDFVPAMMNRAACHLQRGSLHHCIFDCTNALKQLPAVPCFPSHDFKDVEDFVLSESSIKDLSRVGLMTETYERCNPSQRHLEQQAEEHANEKEKRMIMRAHIRRGRALCETGDFERAYEDFVAAAIACALVSGFDSNAATKAGKSGVVNPESPLAQDKVFRGLQADIEAAQRMIECSQLKKQGDSLFRQEEYAQAAELYSQAVELEQHFVGALANRAACYWKIRNLGACAKDCSTVLDSLSRVADFQANDQEIPSEYFPVPRNGSEIHKRLKVNSLVKRANAYHIMGLTQDAFNDIKTASSLDPSIPALQTDSRKLATKLAVRESNPEEEAGKEKPQQ